MENKPTPQPPITIWPLYHRFLYLVIAVLLVVVVGGSTMWWKTQQQVDKDLQAATVALEPVQSSGTANWKTYTNDQYGFSMKLPEGWIQNGNPITESDGSIFMNFASPGAQSNPQFKHYGGELNVLIYRNPSSLTINNFFSQSTIWGQDFMKDATAGTKQIVVDNRSGLRMFDVVGESDAQVAILDDDKRFIEIVDSSIYQNDILNQILSTFKFTK
jgi:hypothetical protein